MGRRRRRVREPGYVWWAGIGVLLVAAVLLTSWRLALIALLCWCLYEFSLVPTACRVMTRQGFACHEPIRGRLFACSAAHQQVKNDALWATVRLPNPFKRESVPDPNRDTGVVVYSPSVRAKLAENDRNLLALAAVGTIVALVLAVAGLSA
ncbi:hypothetical protein NE235_03215 [Actinoallomurus spadix]|uniref:DUF3592 domain-containing protein n=1 Tax=Actinoallomurus spadix TaxID=79912 RepID=A0ABN0XLJ4_9ACTN|nr:hypothetical protein [Actinoallomurus spadix]MCO5985115.1 hypothetical protein [Actinoallomurus spadix]